MYYFFSKNSQSKLNTCCAELIRLFDEVIKHRDCTIICGRRGKAQQNVAYETGKSDKKYPNSYHNKIPSYAIDVAPYFQEEPHIRWDDLDSFREFGGFVMGVAAVLEIPIEWGGYWNSPRDFVHWQVK